MNTFESLELLPHEPPFDAALVRSLDVRGLHCGCNRVLHPGWLNTDVIPVEDGGGHKGQTDRIARIDESLYYLEHDARLPFPIEDEAFEWVHSEHLIEHLTLGDAVAWLREVRRVLRPDGLLRLSTPDLRKYAAAYVEDDREFFDEHRRRIAGVLAMYAEPEQRALETRREQVARDYFVGAPDDTGRKAWMFNQIFYLHHHRWIYDFEELRYVLGLAGFDPAEVVECSCRQGSVPEVFERDRPDHDDESVYIEVVRTR